MIINEPGVLPDSRIYIYEPSAFALKALIFAPFSGHYFCDSPYQILRQNWEYLLLLRIDHGQLELRIFDEQLCLSAGCLCIIDCRNLHHYWAKQPVEFRWIHLNGGSSQTFYEALLNFGATSLELRQNAEVSVVFDTLFSMLRTQNSEELAVNLSATQLFSSWYEAITKESQSNNAAIQKVYQIITQTYLSDIKLEELAQAVNLSVCHLARQYRRQFGVPPHEHLINLRIAKAKKLLLTTQQSIEQIAENCGFNSTSHFIRTFGQKVSSTPGQYRKHKF